MSCFNLLLLLLASPKVPCLIRGRPWHDRVSPSSSWKDEGRRDRVVIGGHWMQMMPLLQVRGSMID